MTKLNKARVLLADDDPAMQQLLGRIISDEGHEVATVADGLSAIARLSENTDASVPFDMVLTDLRMPRADGIEVLRFARDRWPEMPVVVITAFGSIPGAVDAMRLGAFDYLAKPLPSPQTLRDVVARALDVAGQPASALESAEIIAIDPAMKQVIESAEKVAKRDTTVLLLGESGTGKEVIATLLHQQSPRASGPFVAVNCAALSESLLESELFGHEMGAFTGAVARHEGRFAQADNGTLFLDEIGETTPALQAKLLRVLQEKTFEPVGSEVSQSVDVRIIAATNRDLQEAVATGEFREDLYYRLAVFPISLPPLRDRPADILPLAEHFLHLLSRGPSRTTPTLAQDAVAALQQHSWPGNVRELQNQIERALILSGGDTITKKELGLVGPATAPATAGRTLKDMERKAIEDALQAEDGNRRRAAKRLGIALRTLQYKIKDYGLGSR